MFPLASTAAVAPANVKRLFSRRVRLVASFLVAPAALPALLAQDVDVRWSAPVTVAEGGGVRGPWQQNESDFRYVDDPAVALDAQGHAAVVWVDQARHDVFYQTFDNDGAERAQPVNVSRSPDVFSWLPRIVLDPAQPSHRYVLWQEIVFSGGSHGGDIFFARSTDGGQTFTDPINLTQSVAGEGKGRITSEHWHNGSLDLVVGPAGQLHAAWTAYEGPLMVSRSTDGGRSFSPPRQIAGGEGELPARAPTLAIGPQRRVYLAWTVGGDEAADIRLAVSTDDGRTFGEPRRVVESEGYSDAPKLAVSRDGVVHLVYSEAPYERPHVRYTRSTDAAESFEPARTLAEPPPADGVGAGYPAVGLAGSDRLVVTWELFPRIGARPRGLGYTVSSNGGGRFAPPAVVPESIGGGVNGSQQGLLMEKLAVNEDGAVAVVNSSFEEGQGSRVWLMRGRLTSP